MNTYAHIKHTCADKTDWDVWLQYFVFCFDTIPSMAHNYCPYDLVFGKTNNLPKHFDSIDNIETIYTTWAEKPRA